MASTILATPCTTKRTLTTAPHRTERVFQGLSVQVVLVALVDEGCKDWSFKSFIIAGFRGYRVFRVFRYLGFRGLGFRASETLSWQVSSP